MQLCLFLGSRFSLQQNAFVLCLAVLLFSLPFHPFVCQVPAQSPAPCWTLRGPKYQQRGLHWWIRLTGQPRNHQQWFGYFTFAAVIPGTYAVSVEAKNFKMWKQEELSYIPAMLRTRQT